MSRRVLSQDGRQTAFHFLFVRGHCFLSWASSLAEGEVLRGKSRSKVVFQTWASVSEISAHMPRLSPVTLQCLFNLRKFLNLCDFCNTNELWAINDGFKASGLDSVNCGWERWGLPEDFVGRPLRRVKARPPGEAQREGDKSM